MVHPRVNNIFARVNERRGRKDEFPVAQFLHPLVLVSFSQSLTKWWTSSVVNLRLKQAVSSRQVLPSDAMFCSLEWRNLCRALRECPALLYEGCLVESQYFRKFNSPSGVKTRHMNADQSRLTSRSTGVAYVWYLFITTLVLIPTSNMRSYLK